MASNDRPRAIADVSAGTILATVTIAVPPERVFRAITADDQIPLWWGADDMYRTTKHTADLRPGGAWRSEGKSADGQDFHVGGEYLEVEPPHRLVMTWKAPWDGDNVTTVTYTLEAVEEGTRLTLRHDGFGPRQESCRSHGSGWERVLGWLGGFLAAEAGRNAPAVFHCRLIPPRPDFAFTMTEEERALMGDHADYLRSQLRHGTMMIAGPVADPAGPWGLCILRVATEAEARAVTDGDPVLRSGRGFRYEVLPMMSVIM
ncbi:MULTISPECIES: SRPBCC domain-containing protein [unclassified Mesorhizobium]|uniref:SRPBCC domain-containing protein n=1 Tax=unclassified Mesorhizobium TaxID=325217 RepID=UPI000BAF98B4|nr:MULTISPECIES: SRPBCC domain-containing protein [unclassified Mesorhizobium]TGT56762.1 ATPase [Mesorhizobium sp. M00.F.Ca.ET.170.01.1.1]AZO08530.1 ATPase [Mesorhizobium sp. M3A.F.Ca.ET.080.04.2.1]PBB85405.1 ATPase [Mesorhizobium sp. WSM3876]RWB71648.1 MAG: ATPase [Mesorhizobium sp.]RWB85099.1 MAG: ATPase [Mesorhizobium sp.]